MRATYVWFAFGVLFLFACLSFYAASKYIDPEHIAMLDQLKELRGAHRRCERKISDQEQVESEAEAKRSFRIAELEEKLKEALGREEAMQEVLAGAQKAAASESDRLQSQVKALEEKLAAVPPVVTDECARWNMRNLNEFAPEAPPHFNLSQTFWSWSMGLAFTIAPVRCLQQFGWDIDHLRDAQSQYDFFLFIHLMKTGGTALREYIYAHTREKGITDLYDPTTKVGEDASDWKNVARGINGWVAGHAIQMNYHLKFMEAEEFKSKFEGKRAFNFLSMRDPLHRALSSYSYFTTHNHEFTMEQFFLHPKAWASQRSTYYWTQDVFWYLGTKIPKSTDPPEDQIEILERVKWSIRNCLVLISERPLESVALLSAVLGEPRLEYDCAVKRMNTQHTDERPLNLNITRRTSLVLMSRGRYVRVLYEYAVLIFEMRLRQFNVSQILQEKCTAEELAEAHVGRFPEDLFMDNYWPKRLP